MKKKTIITLAAALCALTSCGREMSSFPKMAASPADNASAVAISADNAAASDKNDNISYEEIAADLTERYYEMHDQFMFRFISYSDPDNSVTFRLANPFANREVQDIKFARITGKGFEFNSTDDLKNYRKTVLSDNLMRIVPEETCTEISDEYNDGDYIDETNVEQCDLLYYKSYIMYKGDLYTNTTAPNIGNLGHMPPAEPIIITDVTDTSFKAYYPVIYGQKGMISSLGCDVVDFIIEPSCGEWRINDFVSNSYDVYTNKAAELSMPTNIKDTPEVSAETYKEAAQRELERIAEYRNSLAETEETPEPAETNADKEFRKGVSDGNVYTSEYAGIKITLPEEAYFLDEADLNTRYLMPARFMNEEERNYYLTSQIDACASFYGALSNFDVWFYDTKLRYPENPDITAYDFLNHDELDFSPEVEVTDITAPETVNICGKEYLKVSYTTYSQPHITYARRIDDNYIMAIRTSGLTADEAESCFEAIN